jgi:hypothetical protein
MKYRGIIADNLSKAGWSSGCVSAVDSEARMIWIADAHRVDGNRFIVRPGPPGAPGRPNSDGNNDDGGDGNTLDARDANSMTVLRNTHSRVTGSNTRRDNTRIRNGDSRSGRPGPVPIPRIPGIPMKI